jgi:hypothetical protein
MAPQKYPCRATFLRGVTPKIKVLPSLVHKPKLSNVDIITSPKTFTQHSTTDMKFLTAIKSAKAKAALLAAMTIATSLVGVAPSQANQASRIVGFPGRADIITFKNSSQSFSIGCSALRSVWKLPTETLSDKDYQQLYKVTNPLAGSFICSPSRNQAYTSPSFPPGYAAIEMPGKTLYETDTFYVKNYTSIFKAMGVTPTAYTAQQGQDFINANPRLKTNTVIEPDSIAPAPVPSPPVNNEQMRVTAINRGAYVAKYDINYLVNGNLNTISSGNVTVRNSFTFVIPGNAININFKAEIYGGVKTRIFGQAFQNTHNNVCFTTRGTVFNASIDNTCN